MPLNLIHTGKFPGLGVPGVNFSHPLAPGLKAAYFPAAYPGGTIVNIASPGSGDLITRGGGSFNSSTSEGSGLALTGTGSNLYCAGPAPSNMQPNGHFTAFFRGQYTGNANTNIVIPILGMTFNAQNTSTPIFSWCINPVSSTGSQRFGLTFATSASTSTTTNLVSQVALTVNSMASGGLVVQGNRSTNVASLIYQNGIPYSSASTSNISFYGTTPWITMGDPTGNAGTHNAAFTLTVAYYWNRILSAGSMRYLDANPYSLLLWPSDQVLLDIMNAPSSNPSIIHTLPLLGAGAIYNIAKNVRRNPLLSRRKTIFGKWN